MGASARLGLPWPEGNDAAQGPAAFEALANALDPLTPDANQQAAMGGTSGAPAGNNKFVTDNDARNANQRVPTDGSVTDQKVAAGANIGRDKIAGTPPADDDPRLSDARAPLPHAASHAEGAADDIGLPPIGALMAYAGGVLPAGTKWAWADGGLIDRTTFGTFFGRVGHTYNGGVDPGSNKVRKPDKRGRVSVGADNFGQGAANRIPNSSRAIGQNGGEERHTLLAAESGVNSNGSTNNPGDHTHPPPAGYWGYYLGQPNRGILVTGQGMDSNNGDAGATGPAGGHSHSLTARNADSPHNNLQPYEVDNYIVRVS